MQKYVKWSCAILAAVAVLIQFIPAARTNPPTAPRHELSASTNAPAEKVATLLGSACYDCHSFETRWPWYSRVAPVSWWLVDHVREARQKLNFSEWPAVPAQAQKKLDRISEDVDAGDMPLTSYTLIHRAARLTAEERKLIVQWADEAADKIKLPTAAASAETK